MNWKKLAGVAGVVVALVGAYVLLQEPAVAAWLQVPFKSAPRWAWLALAGLLFGDYALLRVNNPRARAVAEFLPNLLALLLGSFPALEPAAEWVAKKLGTPPPAPKNDAKPDVAGPINVGPGPGAAALLLLMMLPLVSGCPIAGMPPNATFAQKLQADIKAVDKIATDVKAQCGAKFSSFSPTLATFVNGLANYTNPMSDIAAAAALVPELKDDYDALACVLRVVEADIKVLKAPAAQAHAKRLRALIADIEAMGQYARQAARFMGSQCGRFF